MSKAESTDYPPMADAALSALQAFYKKRSTTIELLDRHSHAFDIVVDDVKNCHFPLLSPKEVASSDEIRSLCESLLTLTWHFGDYIRQLLHDTQDYSESEAKRITNDHIKLSDSLQDCAYIVNSLKHGTATKSWGRNRGAQLEEVMILAPDGYGTYCGIQGEEWTDFRGTFAGPIIQTVRVVGKNGNWLGDARQLAEQGAASWLALLLRLEVEHWSNREIDSLIEAASTNYRATQKREGLPNIAMFAKVNVVKPHAMWMMVERVPPVLSMFAQQRTRFISNYRMDRWNAITY